MGEGMTVKPLASRRRFPTTWVIRLVGSALVLAVTLALLPREAVWAAISNISLKTWLMTFFVFLLGHAVAAMKWRMLASLDGDIGVVAALRAHAGGLAANLCLPGVAGGDVVRAGLVMGAAKSKAHVAVGSIADRVIDTFALLFLAAAGALFCAAGAGAFSLLGEIALVLFAGTAAVAALVIGLRYAPKLPFKKLREKLADVAVEFGRRPGRLATCFILSVFVQGVFIGLTVLLAREVGVNAPVAAWYFAWPLAKLIATLPISLAGLGVREAALASLLTPFGASPAAVVAASLLWQSVLFAAGALGGLVLAMSARMGSRNGGRRLSGAASGRTR